MMNRKIAALAAMAGAMLGASASMALADDTTPPAPVSTPTPASPATAAAPAPAAAAPATVTLAIPAMSTPLSLNPSPISIDVGGLGKWYVSGILSGIGIVQNNSVPGDRDGRFDISNAQVFIQKIDGMFQFGVEVGAYSFPVLGAAYKPNSSENTFSNYFDAVPIAYVKIQATDSFSVTAGKLPTLIGAEGTYTYQNMDVTRGLVWNLEPIIQRGVQANYTQGPLTLAVQFNDGFYSSRFNWLEASLAWTINPTNTLIVVGGGNLGNTPPTNEFADAVALNNGVEGNIIYTYNSAPWVITGYLQATSTPAPPHDAVGYGYTSSGSSYGGAVLATYAFTPNFSLGGRVEYLTSTGNSATAPNLVGYGAGSKAFSLTVTPTYQFNRFFVRGDAAYVRAASVTAAFGSDGTEKDQVRGVLEAGVLF